MAAWFRLWNEFPTDPKLKIISNLSCQPLCFVISVYLYLLVSASKNKINRGEFTCGYDEISVDLNLELEIVEKIIVSMDGLLLKKNIILDWEIRQPKREDLSTKRVKKYRESIKYKLKEDAIKILDFLNKKTNRSYRKVNSNINPIINVLYSGITIIECKQVIAKKTRDWSNNKNMSQYLRPITLFNKEKFEQYYGELINVKDDLDVIR